VRAIAAPPPGKVVAFTAGSGERVAASAAGAGGAVIEEIAAVQPTTAKASSKGIPIMTRAQRCHPLDPLSAAEIAVAVATVRAAGRSPEERDSMRFVEVVLLEPEKNVVALADAYFFPPFQPSLLPRTKGSAVIPSRLPPRRARLVVYNKQSNETSIWIVELSEVHAATRGGHHRGKVISSVVVPDVQPAMVCLLSSFRILHALCLFCLNLPITCSM